MKKNKNLIFIFSGGRKERLNLDSNYAKDFFYGYFGFDRAEFDTDIVQITHKKIFIINFLDRLLKKISNFPIALSSIFNDTFKIKIKDSDIILLVNESVMFYSLPYIYFLKKRKKDIKIGLFTMGLFSNFSNNKLKNTVQQFIIKKICFKTIDQFLFLGKGEYEHAVKTFGNEKTKFNFVPFGIDTKFWRCEDSNSLKNKEYLLFVGNDLNRDYEFLKKLVKSMNDYEFIILTSRLSKNELNFKNVKIYEGMWWNNVYSDIEIKELYKKAILTVVPLKESLQPSGQSVTLQSMSMGTPVLITKTSGFWDKEKFEDETNIFFIEKNDVTLWKTKIEKTLKDQAKLNSVSKNGKLLVNENYNLDTFTSKIKSIIS